ncbi:DUF2339 domain-containing protein [Mycobacterium conspicuum]|jgi:uncharacterized membrane protein|uniref:Uncharacterized protein n=1 Tax=Mycobacterium conspicuum TaxID=44010 RepID=A0A1X1TAZ7_9MYCO|nr:DUF2339 domain-containing protein [Mycobacterium conspicuum]ORV41754.1 hypothetical protein AWC00_13210 [Mycobacterium conspicuum]BBZ40661.1 hypothetical protein MCNS_37240 [Mycobacterium conspicuum]
MTEPPRSDRAVFARLSEQFDALSRQMSRVSGELVELDRVIAAAGGATPNPAPPPHQNTTPYWYPQWPQYYPPAAPAPAPTFAYAAPPQPRPAAPEPAAESGWIGKLLAVAGVAVTLVGVVLLLVLAAKAGLLRPEIRVAGGTALSIALVGVAVWMRTRPGGRIGAIALAATGIAAAYLDVIAITTIYGWAPAPVGLVIAAVVGAAGLTLARRWDSEHLGLLVLVPLIGLAPVLTNGVDLLLVAFMMALSAAALPVQLGKDWTWMHAARIAAVSVPLLVTLIGISPHDNPLLIGGACGVAALLAIASGLVLMRSTTDPAALAVLTACGTLPVLASAIGVNQVLAAVLAAALAVGMLCIVLAATALPRIVTQIWSALSAVSGLIAVDVALQGYVEGPVLLALAIIIAVAGRSAVVARWAAAGFGVLGVGLFFSYAPLDALLRATVVPTHIAVCVLAASVLVVGFVVAMARACAGLGRRDPDLARVLGGAAGGLTVYAATAFTVTAGVLVGGTGGGFLAGHMVATICWIGMAAALFVYALRRADREHRTAPITAGLALTAAATAKLFLFDLATLDGIFRVAAFIVVGLVLLGMGAGYARSLADR